ncbi:hypothetical protein IGS61_09675 [Janthinobacterium sp. FW305-129]|uniref:hypothetical protein n=1 Tax=Janthinobacterium sp. FW305-129 TaxID=2775054 RepID=UPI001E6274D1|nr:hypothetical protein [Janthinobacterium sp. FW305-129]MCC7597755.1 hypothetical protein [Janthinobacterium sp. FW305-129]
MTTKSQAVAVAAYLFAIETAMRAGEICGLMPAWVDGAVARLPAYLGSTKTACGVTCRYRRAR